MTLQPSRISLSEETRETMIGLLNARLADAVALAAAMKQAHWNVRGPNFRGLHELFDDAHGLVDGAVDDIAERITALGGLAAGTVQAAADNTELPSYSTDLVDEQGHVSAVAEQLSAFGGSVRAAIDASSDAGDEGTADLFTGLVREIDKMLWFVEAHVAPVRITV